MNVKRMTVEPSGVRVICIGCYFYSGELLIDDIFVSLLRLTP